MLGRMSRVGEGARVLLGLIRLVNGTAAMVAPEPIGRRLGIEPVRYVPSRMAGALRTG